MQKGKLLCQILSSAHLRPFSGIAKMKNFLSRVKKNPRGRPYLSRAPLMRLLSGRL